MQEAEYFLQKAEECFRLAELARGSNGRVLEIAERLEALGNEFMTKAVEIETVRQKIKRL